MGIMGTSTHGSENGSEDSYPTLGNSLHSDRWERGTVQSETSSQGQGLDRYIDRSMGTKGMYGGGGGIAGMRSHHSHRQASQSRFLTSQSIAAYFGRVEGGNMRTLPLSLPNPDETLDSIGATLDLIDGHHTGLGLDRIHNAGGSGLGRDSRQGQGLGEGGIGQWTDQTYRPVFIWNPSFLSGNNNMTIISHALTTILDRSCSIPHSLSFRSLRTSYHGMCICMQMVGDLINND